MNWSLSNALATSGYDLPIKEADSAYMNLSQFRFAMLWLKNSRGNIVDATQSDSAWDFTLGDSENQEVEIAQTLMREAAASVTEVTVRSSPHAQHLRVSYSALETLCAVQSAGRPIDTMMAILELRNDCSLGDTQVLKLSDLKFAAASIGLPLLLKDEYSLVPHLRQLLSISRTSGADEVVQVLNQVFVQVRNPDAGTKRKVASTLDRWLKAVSAPVLPQSRSVTVHR